MNGEEGKARVNPRFDDPAPCAPVLRGLGACAEAVVWVGDRDFRTALAECSRADWILWLCGRMVDTPTWPTQQQLTLAACACAETALRFVPPSENRPRLALETARRWARGDATVTLADVRHAAYAAYAAADAAASDASASDADAAADAAASAAAYAAAYAAADAAAAGAYAAYAAAARVDMQIKILRYGIKLLREA